MAAAAAKVVRAGLKQVFLPDHVLTLCRPARLVPPNFAKFKVPLRFNKLDMKDYLRNVYNVETTAVRSHIIQKRPTIDKLTLRLKRPPSIKYMMVELRQSFAFPDDLTEEDIRKWHDPAQEKRIEMEKDFGDRRHRQQMKGEIRSAARSKLSEDRRAVRKQAQALLSGNVKWNNQRTLDPKWIEGQDS